jgi:hypothetical protein
MTGAEILKKYDNEWNRLSAGKLYYDIPITIRKSFFFHACMEIQKDVELFIMVHGYSDAISAFGEPICRWIHFGIEPKEF